MLQDTLKSSPPENKVSAQPIFGFVEKWSSEQWPENNFINLEIPVEIPCYGTYCINLFRLIWRTVYVIITALLAMIFPFFNDFLGLIGAASFWPLTVYFPVEMHIARTKMKKYSFTWTWLKILSWGCLVVTLVAAAGSVQGAAKAGTGASKNIRPNRRPARGNLDVEDTTGKEAAAATPETKAKSKGRTSRKDKQDGTSNEPEGTRTLEIKQESVSGSLKSQKRTAAEKAKVGISRQAQANPEQDGHQKEHLPSKGRISIKEEKATAENDEGQKKRRLSTLYADERLKDKQPEQEKPDSKKAKMSSAKKEGKSEVPKLAESVKKEKPVSPTRAGLLLVCFIQAPKLLAKPEELRTRRLKVMKTLGLIGPSVLASPSSHLPYASSDPHPTLFLNKIKMIQSSNEMIGASNIDSVMDQDDDGQKPAEPSRSHKETERRRRQRINSHLSTLRSLLPNPTKKTDKASLLAGVVHHVRQLRQQLAAFSRQHTDPSSSCSCSRLALADPEQWPFPGDSDEATLISCHGSGLLKVTLCCDDRPGLNGELARTFRAFHAKEIRAEMASSGGRAKLEVLVEWVGRQDEDRVSGLKRALEAVVENRARRLSYRNKQARTSYELS
ncbi:hypothetical protein CDL15_Pgr011454 [Punica granatum]|uniref:BHLH domain-containing protein n=1 Tax=Punica granatum TaxID=22663 RepID=A0A218WET1_PUNGR|nr:hypothetical protein CDL15_Pgr011454 [Punica granatum]